VPAQGAFERLFLEVASDTSRDTPIIIRTVQRASLALLDAWCGWRGAESNCRYRDFQMPTMISAGLGWAGEMQDPAVAVRWLFGGSRWVWVTPE
jgi:hypothetical protein